MQIRVRLLMVATACLYVGPLLAGLGGFGWATVPLFLALFMLWLFILRPQQWPSRLSDWRHHFEPWTALVTNMVVQLLLVLALFGIGRGIGGALQFQASYTETLPLMVSFLAIPFARLVWDPWTHESLNDLLDVALHKDALPQESEPLALARRLIAPLQSLPETTAEAEIAEHLAAMAAHVAPAALHAALMERGQSGNATQVERLALTLQAANL